MANKSKFQAIKGTRDLLPPETALWNQVEQTAREVFATFHFGEIRLPIFETTELFARAVGGDTDIVGKEMYTFERKLSFLREDFAKAASFVSNSDDLLRALQSFGIKYVQRPKCSRVESNTYDGREQAPCGNNCRIVYAVFCEME